MIGTCKICGEPTPPHANSWRARKVCDNPECRRAVYAAGARKARAAYMKKHPTATRTHYRCSACGVEKPLTAEHFYVERRDPETDEVTQWGRWCIPCKRERARVASLSPEQIARRRESARRAYERKTAKMKRDPRTLEESRAEWRESARKWRARNPESSREAQRRYQRKVQSSPQLHRAALERNRMAGRLRRERKDGVPLDSQRRGKVADFLRPRPVPDLPARQLADAVERRITRSSRGREEVCKDVGVSPRTLYAWRVGERYSCGFSEADAALGALALNWWDVWFCDAHGGDERDCSACQGVRLAEGAFEGSKSDEHAA